MNYFTNGAPYKASVLACFPALSASSWMRRVAGLTSVSHGLLSPIEAATERERTPHPLLYSRPLAVCASCFPKQPKTFLFFSFSAFFLFFLFFPCKLEGAYDYIFFLFFLSRACWQQITEEEKLWSGPFNWKLICCCSFSSTASVTV